MNKTIRRIIPLLLILVLCVGFVPQKAEAAVRLNRSTATVGIRQTITLKVTGAKTKVKWKSSNKKIATVSSKGVVKGIKKGTATITAKVKKKKYTCRVTVTQSAAGAKSGKKQAGTRISANAASVGVQKTITLRMIGAKSKVKWKSSNKKIATVNSKGVVKGLKKGTVTITAKVKKKKYTCRVTVVQPVTSVRLNRTSAAIKNGNTLSLGATAGPASANNRGIAWRSSNARVATVNANGTVRAVGKGTAVITATAKDGSGRSASCRVTVTQPVTGVRLNRTSASMNKGDSMALGATASPSNADNKAVTWKSSNTNVATVNANGAVRAVGKGTVTITAVARDSNGKAASCTVTVVEPKPAEPVEPVETVTIEEPETPADPAKPADVTTTEDPDTPTDPQEPASPDSPDGPDAPSTITESAGPTELITTEPTAENEEIPETPEAAHTHTWVDVVETVHHDEKSHMETQKIRTETIVDQEAWDEDIYETTAVSICKECGYTTTSTTEMEDHLIDEHEGDAYSVEKRIQVKVDTKHHDAVTHEEPVYEEVKVVDEKAWDETVVIGQKCSGCGATK